jgi:hypothetical protein
LRATAIGMKASSRYIFRTVRLLSATNRSGSLSLTTRVGQEPGRVAESRRGSTRAYISPDALDRPLRKIIVNARIMVRDGQAADHRDREDEPEGAPDPGGRGQEQEGQVHVEVSSSPGECGRDDRPGLPASCQSSLGVG